ncbi:BTAD domain-containing putative transcriptional regulator [Kribbella deserti]|uniref:BTAD domain-containing putative transcriptional regulator n=1 Tax=Kribbella deserti TaxID=1926257 RepID=A0ABV6QV88_9ACTN
MRFGVLGPLQVWSSTGKPGTIRETKVRALLAYLLSYDGRPVPADRLIEDLWGDRLPANPVSTLQTRVWQLRKALEEIEPGGKALVLSGPAGYGLAAPAVDSEEFRALVAKARANGDPMLLTEALALWRGTAYEGFEFAEAVRARLEEERLVAQEDLADARLALGQHRELVSELGELVTLHPLRERLHALHLQALYGAGRQAEALERYDALRRRLADELGVDPSPELSAVYQAVLRQEPTLATRSRTNLPEPLTELIGRDEALATVKHLLTTNRLVTLTGSGGVGKTRMALEAARQVAAGYPDGAWLVELAGTDSPAEAVAAVLSVRDSSDEPLVDRLAQGLHGKRMLLVLDNCEHLIEPVAELARVLLARVPGLRILATSQESLAVDGERLWAVPPLELDSAVELFTARAASAVPGFVADDAQAVAAICQRLDGIPLALELAATRVRALGVRELAERLDDRFGLLVTGRRGAPARQQTLRAMIDWSWDLLTESERIVLRRLAVQAEGCTLAAAEAVCAGDGIKPSDVLDLISRLVDRSLVVAVPTADGPRYRLLESVTAYCLERLEERATVEARHRRYYLDLAVEADTKLRGHDQQLWLSRLDVETANLRTALESSIATGDAETALRLTTTLGWYWFVRGRLGEARRSLARALALPGPTDAKALAGLWRAAFTLLVRDGVDPVTADLDDLYAAARDRGLAALVLGSAHLGFGESTVAARWLDRAAGDFTENDRHWGTATIETYRASGALVGGDLAQARELAARSTATFRELGERWGLLRVTEVLAFLAEIGGDYAEATRLHEDGLCYARELGLWIEASYELSGLGRLALLAGDFEAADNFHRQGMDLARAQSHQRGVQFAEVGLGLSARRQGELDRAETHLRAWLDWCREYGGAAGVALILAELGFTAEQRGDADQARALHTEGLAAAKQVGDPRAIALAYEGLAGVESLTGNTAEARRLLDRAAALRDSVGAPLPEGERFDLNRITARL